jgi:phytoene/squalene synthetase
MDTYNLKDTNLKTNSNMDTTTALSHTITRKGSKQSYYSLKFMADKDLVDNALGAYAYFRWVDDFVDDVAQSNIEREAFIHRQKEIIDKLYQHNLPKDPCPEEKILARLIESDRGENSKLQSYLRNMMAITAFDARRKGQLITQKELDWYSSCLAKAVIDHLQHFICHDYPYPTTNGRYVAAIGAHVAHMLRDMVTDISNGYINIPKEYLETHKITPEDIHAPAFRAWVEERVALARQFFDEGKHYLNTIEALRYKVVCFWYCTRFDGLLDAIEREDYFLREGYNERHKLGTCFKLIWLGNSVTIRHFFKTRTQNV